MQGATVIKTKNYVPNKQNKNLSCKVTEVNKKLKPTFHTCILTTELIEIAVNDVIVTCLSGAGLHAWAVV
jgi:hypothetical protein